MSFGEQILQFNDKLSHKSLDLPTGYKLINPFNGNQKEFVKEITTKFYKKYYNDNKPRRLILGSSPARRGTSITGVPFEDADHLQKETNVFIENFYISKSSSNFLYEVMDEYGGRNQFYYDFYMNFVCPLGIVKTNSKGNEVNCNYYETKTLQKALYPLIIDSIQSQIDFGIDSSVCYCIGSGENYKFLLEINEKYHFFETIIPLEHPRFIMQYNSNNKDVYIKKYINALSNCGLEK